MDDLESKKKYDEVSDLPAFIKVKPSQKPDDNGSIWKSLGILFGGISILFILMLILVPGAGIIFIMWLASAPQSLRLPYNAIDLQKIAYIDNQFVMYGIDYDKSKAKQLVIFNSVDGEKWDKSKVKISNYRDNSLILMYGTFAYFKGKCYLIGVTDQPLVADDCRHWETKKINALESNSSYLSPAYSSAVINNKLYVGGNKGIYVTDDGTLWHKEVLNYPYPESPDLHTKLDYRDWAKYEESATRYEKHFYNMVASNDKLVTTSNWKHGGEYSSLIFIKDLVNNKWSVESYPERILNLARGKDRFVAMSEKPGKDRLVDDTEDTASVLVDGSNDWRSSSIMSASSELVFGLDNKFIGTSIVNLSYDGIKWESLLLHYEGHDDYNPIHLACSSNTCIAVGLNYKIAISHDGRNWVKGDFKYENAKPGWWRRFF
ncbi:MAG: hypothetical protein K2X04_00265 [Burkholderiales bacterium]|nr:hypothetical protein [Burkholderiales bacterium]